MWFQIILQRKQKDLWVLLMVLDLELGSGVTFQMKIFLSYILGISLKIQKLGNPAA